MADQQIDNKAKAAKAKESLDKLNASLKKITTASEEKMKEVLKKNEAEKVNDILKQLRGI